MGVRCVLASIALTITIRARKAISLAKVISRGRVVTSLVLVIIVKAVMGREEVAISPVPVTIVKEAINLAKVVTNREKVAISPVLATIVKAATNRERVPINSVKVVSTAVLVLTATILMLSTA